MQNECLWYISLEISVTPTSIDLDLNVSQFNNILPNPPKIVCNCIGNVVRITQASASACLVYSGFSAYLNTAPQTSLVTLATETIASSTDQSPLQNITRQTCKKFTKVRSARLSNERSSTTLQDIPTFLLALLCA